MEEGGCRAFGTNFLIVFNKKLEGKGRREWILDRLLHLTRRIFQQIKKITSKSSGLSSPPTVDSKHMVWDPA